MSTSCFPSFPTMKRFLNSALVVSVLCSTSVIVSAINIDNALQYRQVVPKGTGSTASAAASSSLASSILSPSPNSFIPTSSSSSASQSSSSSPDPNSISSDISSSSTSITSLQAAPSSSPSPSSSDIGLTSTSQSVLFGSTSGPSSNDPTSSSSGRLSTITSTSVSFRTQEYQTTIITVSGSHTISNILTTSGLRPVTTSTTLSKSTPGLDANDGNSNGSGLKHSTKITIIGTVVGIGGALLLAGIGLVAWRIWGKRKHQVGEDHDLLGLQPGSSGHEKRSSVSGNSPFRSTLDQYHNPAGPVNTASNF